MATGGSSSTMDRMADEDLVGGHLPLVQYAVAEVASRAPRNVSRSDLASAAMEGLAQAARGLAMRPVERPPVRIRRPIRPIAIILATSTKQN